MENNLISLSEQVQITLINQIVPGIIAITGFIIAYRKIRQIDSKANKIEKQTNGNLTREIAKVERAEKLFGPDVTAIHPEGVVVEGRLSVNNPANEEPAKIIENKVTF